MLVDTNTTGEVGDLNDKSPTSALKHSEEGNIEISTPSPGGMRRNLTAAASLSTAGIEKSSSTTNSNMRRNTSASTLSELRRREQQDVTLAQEGSCAAVVEAVACKLLELVLGRSAMLAAMRENMQTIPEENLPATKRKDDPIGDRHDHACECDDDSSQNAKVAPPDATLPPGISASLQGYIHTIVRHLELPNSCIVAALIYVMRAVNGTRFSLSLTNWQPCLLAAFVIAAKLSFDEPVWNEDFAKALRISNVQVSQISRWEADFLQLLSYNTNVTVAQYATTCFELQKAHEDLHQKPCHFFTYLMALSTPVH